MPPRLAFDIGSEHEAVRLSIAGELDLATAPALDREVHGVVSHSPTRLVLDLSAVTFCDSTGVAALFRARDAAVTAGSEFEVTGASGMVHRVLVTIGALDALNAKPA
jgi:anti-sigma B factor antagonist